MKVMPVKFSRQGGRAILADVTGKNIKIEELKRSMKKNFKTISVLLTVVLLMSAFATPVAAGRENGRGQERGQERQNAQQVQYLDAEVLVIDGQPLLRYEIEDGYADIPFEIPAYALSVDGQKVAVERQGDAILLPTEDGFEAVPLKDFSVVMMNGQIMLLAEVNPIWKLVPIAVGLAFKAKLISALSAVGIRIVSVSIHFIEMAITRGISIANIVTVLASGQRFVDVSTGARVAYHAGLRIAVIIDRTSNSLITIYNNAPLKHWRWVPLNWSW
jgi:hypothetical protein